MSADVPEPTIVCGGGPTPNGSMCGRRSIKWWTVASYAGLYGVCSALDIISARRPTVPRPPPAPPLPLSNSLACVSDFSLTPQFWFSNSTYKFG